MTRLELINQVDEIELIASLVNMSTRNQQRSERDWEMMHDGTELIRKKLHSIQNELESSFPP